MSFHELIVVIGGLLLGYWVVSYFSGQKAKATKRPAGVGQEPPSKSGAQNNTAPPHEPPPAREQQPETPRASYPPAWYDVLEIPPNALASEIRTAYRGQISKYHPDKVAALGTELKEVAERKSKEIGEAYKTGMQIRGENP